MNESDVRQKQRAERILAAAGGLFAHYGYDKTTMEDIAREADVSKGALYLHFRSKEDLFDALMERETALVEEAVLAHLDAGGDSFDIFSLYRASIESAQTRPLLRALLTGNKRIIGDYVTRIRQATQASDIMGFSSEFVVHMQRAGLMRAEVNPDALAALLLVLKFGLLSLPDLMPNPPPAETMGAAMADMLQRAFGTEFGSSEDGRNAVRQMFVRVREFLTEMRAQQEGRAAP